MPLEELWKCFGEASPVNRRSQRCSSCTAVQRHFQRALESEVDDCGEEEEPITPPGTLFTGLHLCDPLKTPRLTCLHFHKAVLLQTGKDQRVNISPLKSTFPTLDPEAYRSE